ncbi:RICIN domain-containing protein [Nocardiopsis dassonvillei]|uniref:RICIN domain-containing protein n=1 Tax=Nocardiopsis dassonvillei TaxID=2014 RepID=UPI0036316584
MRRALLSTTLAGAMMTGLLVSAFPASAEPKPPAAPSVSEASAVPADLSAASFGASAQSKTDIPMFATHLNNRNSGKCLVVRGTGNESPAVQHTCNASYDDQKWYVRFVGSYVQLVNLNSGKCLVVRGTGNESRAVQHTCNASYTDQQWSRRYNGSYFQLVNRNSGKCLIVRGTGNESPAVQYPCNTRYTDQYWYGFNT